MITLLLPSLRKMAQSVCSFGQPILKKMSTPLSSCSFSLAVYYLDIAIILIALGLCLSTFFFALLFFFLPCKRIPSSLAGSPNGFVICVCIHSQGYSSICMSETICDTFDIATVCQTERCKCMTQQMRMKPRDLIPLSEHTEIVRRTCWVPCAVFEITNSSKTLLRLISAVLFIVISSKIDLILS